MTNKLNISTLNVRALANDVKRRTVTNWLSSKYDGILFLQETHSDEAMLNKWKKECNFDILPVMEQAAVQELQFL